MKYKLNLCYALLLHNEMKKLLIALVVIGIIIAVVVLKRKPAVAPEQSTSPAVSLPSDMPPLPPVPGAIGTPPKKQTTTITFANGAATPSVVAIKVGDMVKFVNNDTSPRWPASGPHPVHTTCPGFDSLRGLKTGESYSFTFLEAKTCPWHDHLKPSVNGKIEVTQ